MSGSSLQPVLGQRLREARRARGLKLKDVAAATGISASSLSLVETGQNEPTVGRLARLCTLYELSITELLPAGAAAGGPARGRDETTLSFAGEGVSVTVLESPSDARMQPVSLRFEPGGSFAEHVVIESDVFLILVEGTLEVTAAGRDDVTLHPGDSVYLLPGVPHRYRNPSTKHHACAIGVSSPPLPGRA